MPKLIPEEDKRVPLNCLILPSTRAALLKLRNSSGDSHGELVDQAIALLNDPGRVVSVYTPTTEEKIKRNVTPRPYKGPLLKPSEK